MPFPFVETDEIKSRPALIVSGVALGPRRDLFIAAMITGSKRDRWDGDVTIDDLDLANLPIPSVIRTSKVTTLSIGDAHFVGRVGPSVLANVIAELHRTLSIDQR